MEEDASMRTLIRLVLVLVLVVGVAALLLGYWGGYRAGTSRADDGPTGTSGTVNTERAREIGAEVGERTARATARAKEELGEAAITARIKAKMALDDLVKARSIDVTTSGGIVTLSGRVGSAAESERAERLARETEGVTSVRNRVTVDR
jgi:hyperosmotically inducible protein